VWSILLLLLMLMLMLLLLVVAVLLLWWPLSVPNSSCRLRFNGWLQDRSTYFWSGKRRYSLVPMGAGIKQYASWKVLVWCYYERKTLLKDVQVNWKLPSGDAGGLEGGHSRKLALWCFWMLVILVGRRMVMKKR